MRFKIMFGITAVILLYLLFYPRTSYLNIYNDSITIDYNTISTNEDYSWTYTIDNNNIQLLENNDSNKWTFIPYKNGETNLTYYYKNENDETLYRIIYVLKIKDNKIYWVSGEGYGLLDYPNLY